MPSPFLYWGQSTLSVAASDASDASKGRADYVCDGTDDQAQLDAAVSALPSAGGRILLSEGTFNRTTTWTLSGPIIIQGMGGFGHLSTNQTTVINFTLGAGGNCMQFSDDLIPQTIRNLCIVGDDTNTEKGIYVDGSCGFKQAIDILVTGITTHGVRFDDGSSQCWFDRVYVREPADSCFGFEVYGVNHTFMRCQSTRSSAQGPTGSYQGFKIHATGSALYSCVTERHFRGFEIGTYCNQILLYGCYGEANDRHIRIDGSVSDEPTGTTIVGFLGNSCGHGTNAAVYVDNSFGTILEGISIYTTTSDKAIELTANADTVSIIGGATDDTTPITDGGATRLKIKNFYPYVAENEGAAASVADGGTIAHGLSATPSVAIVSASVAGEIATVSGLDGTNITVDIKDNDDSAGTTQTIYWRAWV